MVKNRLIIFLIPPEKLVNGGILSIFSLCEESRALFAIHKSEVVISTYVGYPSYGTNDLFTNNEHIYDFNEVIKKYPDVNELLIHVPELAVTKLANKLPFYSDYLSKLSKLHINILNQNIRYMPSIQEIYRLFEFADRITQTTAHDKYASQDISDKYGIPLKHFSVYLDPGQYKLVDFNDKQDIIAYSPDSHPKKEVILKHLSKALPSFRLLEIKNMTYEQYKRTIEDAKFMITFGEGLDGYFIESTFSGGIPLAVYNEDFFVSEDFSKLATVYNSYDDMFEKSVDSIAGLNSKNPYSRLNNNYRQLLSQFYNYKSYQNNLAAFYREEFDFYPSSVKLIESTSSYIRKNLESIRGKDRLIERQQKEIERERLLRQKKEVEISGILSSHSWRLTQPLRSIYSTLRKK